MTVLAVALVVAVACGAFLRHVRRGSGCEDLVGVRRAWTQVVSFGFAASVSWSLFELVLSGVGLVTGPTPEPPPPAAFGAIVGLSLYVHGRVLFLYQGINLALVLPGIVFGVNHPEWAWCIAVAQGLVLVLGWYLSIKRIGVLAEAG